ncbi:MAG: hypothetical protein LBT22_03180 [Peptococcaceae bacterium]|jgi:uncharacterized membrane protein YkvI|nr:hypothetical protein [Peptococcaceae bacterium]
MNWRVSFQVAATYVGAVMGAGFASGQEIQQFFVLFEGWGLAGILFSTALFSFLGWLILDLQQRWQIASYPEFFLRLLGPRWGNRVEFLISILLFVGILAMLTGSGALFHQYLGLAAWKGVVFTEIMMAVALWRQGEGVLWINTVLIPLKFLCCLGIAALAVLFGVSGDGEGFAAAVNPLIRHWAFSSVLYVSFNITLAVVVFASLGKEVQKPGARLGAALGGVALGVFAMMIGVALLRFPEVIGMEIPMVAIAGKLGDWPAVLYVIVLWLAMLTASVSNGFSLVCRMRETGRVSYGGAMAILLLAVLALAGVRFSQIVQIGYPLFGYCGLFFLPALCIRWLRR